MLAMLAVFAHREEENRPTDRQTDRYHALGGCLWTRAPAQHAPKPPNGINARCIGRVKFERSLQAQQMHIITQQQKDSIIVNASRLPPRPGRKIKRAGDLLSCFLLAGEGGKEGGGGVGKRRGGETRNL